MSSTKIPIVVLVSGNGTNLQALLDAERDGRLENGYIAAVISDRPGVYALERARQAGKPAILLENNRHLPREQRRRDLSDRILTVVQEYHGKLIVLAGFLSILTGTILDTYAGRIINIHPSLLPEYGGPGMYGERVHRAVLAAGEKQSGCTVHLVDAGTDTGPIIIQKVVPVLPGDTPETLAGRIHEEEHRAIVEGVRIILQKIEKSEVFQGNP